MGIHRRYTLGRIGASLDLYGASPEVNRILMAMARKKPTSRGGVVKAIETTSRGRTKKAISLPKLKFMEG